MKKAIFALMLLAGGWEWHERKLIQKEHLKEETWVRHLKLPVFREKLQRPLPKWMQDQIEEDFADFEEKGISKAQVDATFQKIIGQMNPKSYIVRYRILDHELYRYFLDDESISLEDNSTEKALKTLLACTSLQDLDFLLSYFDGVPLLGVTEKLYRTDDPDLQAPLFFSAKLRGTRGVILIPDWRSIGHWWISDIKHITKRMAKFPWEKKKPFAIWRGGLTHPIRLDLCRLSLRHPEYLDAKLNDAAHRKENHEPELYGEKVSWEEFLECRYLPYVDGVMCAAPALQWRLLSQCLVFKPDSEEIQWFYRALYPYVHYIPIRKDFSDLVEKIDWAKENDALCKGIADAACRFAKEHLMYEDVLLYFASVLKRYASLQQVDRKEWKREVRKDRRWVKIQQRKKMKKERPAGSFIKEATPF